MINLIWLDIEKNFNKIHWIKFLLNDIKYQELFTKNLNINHLSLYNSIIIINNNPNLYNLHSIKYPYILIHLNDKDYMHDINIYNNKNCKLIIRNYYMPSINKKIIFIPLGSNYKYNHFKQKDKKNYIWSFIGKINKNIDFVNINHPLELELYKNQRINIINDLLKFKYNYYLQNSNLNYVTDDYYKNILLNSIFVPCIPDSYNIEIERIYDALECGAIPIVLNKTIFQNYNYFEKLFKSQNNLPFFYIDFFRKIQHNINNIQNINHISIQIQDIWYNYKLQLKKQLTYNINSIFSL